MTYKDELSLSALIHKMVICINKNVIKYSMHGVLVTGLKIDTVFLVSYRRHEFVKKIYTQVLLC